MVSFVPEILRLASRRMSYLQIHSRRTPSRIDSIGNLSVTIPLSFMTTVHKGKMASTAAHQPVTNGDSPPAKQVFFL